MKATPISNTADELPKGWTQTTVGEIAARVQYGTSAKTGSDSEGVPVIRMGNIADGLLVIDKLKYLPTCHKEFPELLLANGDVLFNRTNSAELVGKTAVYQGNPSPCSFASYLIRVRLGDVYRPELLAHYINSCFGHAWIASVVSQQVGQANVNGSKLRALWLPVPPLLEQHRIVAEIDKQFTRLAAAVAALKRVRVNLKRYRASVLNAACAGRLVATDNELARAEGRDYEPADALLQRIAKERRAKWEGDELSKLRATHGVPKDGKWRIKHKDLDGPRLGHLPSLPEGWKWASVAELGTDGEQPVLTGPFGTNLGREDFSSEGVPVLTIGCLTNSGVVPENASFVSEEKAAELDRYRLRTGDLLFSRMASVGRAGLVGASLNGALFNYHIMRLRLAAEVILPTFYLIFVRGAKTVEDYLREVNHGATRPGINTEQLLNMPVALPPIAEQHRIVAEVERRLSIIDEAEAIVAPNIKRAERLRQSILKRAFEGKLVPQDPNDEPASILLERIRAERIAKTSDAGHGQPGSKTKRKRFIVGGSVGADT